MTISSAGSIQRPRRTDGQALISTDGWFAYSWRNPGGAEPGDAATPTATQWVRWGGGSSDRLIAIGGGKQQGASAFKEIIMPLDGVMIPVSDGTVRTVVAASATVSSDYGGIALAAWDTLWAKLDWTAGTTQATEFLVVRGSSAVDDNSMLPQTDPNIEWIMIASSRSTDTILLWNGDTLRRGQEIGQCGSLAAQVNNDRKAFDDMQLRGCMFLTQSQAIGMTNVLMFRGVAGNGPTWGENLAPDVAPPAIGTSVRLVGGTGGGTDVAFRAPVAADQMYLFGAQSTSGAYGNFNALAAVLDRPAAGAYTGTLHVHRRQGTSARVGGVVPAVTSWFMHAADTSVSAIPSSWMPVVSIGAILSGGEGLYIPRTGTVLGRNDIAMHGVRDHEASIARSTAVVGGPPQVRWTGATFIQPGAVPNGSTRFTVAERGLLVGWDDTALALSYGSATGDLLGSAYIAADVPAVGYAIPVAGMPGATRVVQALAGTTRRYIPLARDEMLVYRPALGGGYNDAGWLVIPVGAPLVPLSGSIVVAYTRGVTDTGAGTTVYFLNGLVQVSPGLFLQTTTPTFGDVADSHNTWANAVLPTQTPPGGTAALPAVPNVAGTVRGAQPEYLIMRDPCTMRKICRIRGVLRLVGDIADSSTLLFLPGAYARNSTRLPATIFGTSTNKPRAAVVYPFNGSIGGMNGVQLRVLGASLATNPGLAGGDDTWGTPTELWFDITIDMA